MIANVVKIKTLVPLVQIGRQLSHRNIRIPDRVNKQTMVFPEFLFAENFETVTRQQKLYIRLGK
jgi:late competence protein required for DNA uptake (superfamily II DNA/RNA helicase)